MAVQQRHRSAGWLLLLLTCTSRMACSAFSGSYHQRSEFRIQRTIGITSSILNSPHSSSPDAAVVLDKNNEQQHAPSTNTHDRANDSTTSTSTSIFQTLAHHIADTVIRSDAKRDTGFDGASTGWTSWIDETAATELQAVVDDVRLKQRQSANNSDNDEDDEVLREWMSWIRACPAPMIVELSPQLRHAVAASERYQSHLKAGDVVEADERSQNNSQEMHIINNPNAFLQRLGMRLIYLPSGATLPQPLRTAPGAMVYGILLLNGVTRFRLIGSSSSSRPKRRAGERTSILAPSVATTTSDSNRLVRRQSDKSSTSNTAIAAEDASSSSSSTYSWLQYGGPERNYQAIDMGPCLVLEILLLPFGLELPLLHDEVAACEMVLSQLQWNPDDFLCSEQERMLASSSLQTDPTAVATTTDPPPVNVCDLQAGFCGTVGGLQTQIDEIVRRVLDGRVVRPVSSDASHELDVIRRQEMEGLLELGLQPVRGLLLYGPPGKNDATYRFISHECANKVLLMAKSYLLYLITTLSVDTILFSFLLKHVFHNIPTNRLRQDPFGT